MWSSSIGSPKSTVTVADAALVGEASSVDRVGPGVALSKVTLQGTLDAVLSVVGNVHDAVGGDLAVTSPSAPGVRVNVKVWLAEELVKVRGRPAGN